ncbi:MAG: hypothetical protein KBC73_21260 [Burkholderiaceae bacterium]|nr:hypothetical protein [Burkholderiaceae bacterium]
MQTINTCNRGGAARLPNHRLIMGGEHSPGPAGPRHGLQVTLTAGVKISLQTLLHAASDDGRKSLHAPGAPAGSGIGRALQPSETDQTEDPHAQQRPRDPA